MSETDSISNSDTARTLYESAIQFALHEGNILWARFSVVTLANSIVIFSFAQTLTNTRLSSAILAVILPIGGIVLCLLWIPLTERSFEYEQFYIFAARELEEKHFAPPGTEQFLTKGGRFSKGDEIRFHLMVDSETKLKMPWSAGLQGRIATRLIIIGFFVFYIIAFLLASVNLLYLLAKFVCHC